MTSQWNPISFDRSRDKSHDMQVLWQIIDRAAYNAHVFPEEMAYYMTYLYEAIADEVAAGEIVYMPGLGKMFPLPRQKRGRLDVRIDPVFHPSAGFRNQVSGCAMHHEHIRDQYLRWCRKTLQRASRAPQARSWTMLDRLRANIQQSARDRGIDVNRTNVLDDRELSREFIPDGREEETA